MNPVKEVAMVAVEPKALDIVSQIVALAANPDMDVAKLEKLIDLQERVMRRDAEAQFNAAFAEMQSEIPTVIEKGKGDSGKWFYAPLEDIVAVMRPILQKHGFSLSHRTEWPDKGTLKVVGILSHVQGHSRQSEFLSSADPSGSKNAIQGLGSANAYGRRYTTNDLLGIVTRKQDDDGAKTGTAEVVDPQGYEDWRMDIELTANEKGLAALTEEWKVSAKNYRDHTLKHYAKAWEITKQTAAKVKAVTK